MFAYCENNPVMRCDPNGDVFWDTIGKMAVGAAVGAATYAVTQLIAGEPINAKTLALSAGEGALTAVSGTLVGAAISGIAAGYNSYKAGNSLGEVLVDAAFATGSSLLGSGAKYIGGRVKLSIFKNTATKGQLKALGGSLKKTKRHGNEFKQLAKWGREMNHLGSKHFMNSSYARYYGYLASSSSTITYSLVRSGR